MRTQRRQEPSTTPSLIAHMAKALREHRTALEAELDANPERAVDTTEPVCGLPRRHQRREQ